MALGAFREKQLVRCLGRAMRLETRLPDKQWHLTDLATGLSELQPEAALLSHLELGELVFIAALETPQIPEEEAFLNQLSSAAQVGNKHSADADTHGEEAVYRLKYVKETSGHRGEKFKETVARIHLEIGWPKRAPAYSTVCAWRQRQVGTSDPVDALRSRHAKKGRRGPRHSPEVIEIMRDVRDTHFLQRTPRITIAHALEIVQDTINVRNKTLPPSQRLSTPRRKALEAIIHEVDAYEVIAARYGADEAMRQMRASLGGKYTSRPLERAEIDHTRLAVVLLDEDLTPLGRAYFTAAKDSHTRAALGIYWGFEPPSVVSLARCIKHGVLPKTEFLKGFPAVTNEWPCYGVAESLVMDNGLEEHASAIRQAAAQLGIQNCEFCARARPWQKPNIERWLRQQDQGLNHTLPGATMENIAKRTDFDPKKDLLLRKSTFDVLLVKWVVDVYMQQGQKALKGRSPYQAWKDGEAKLLFQPLVPTSTTLLERLFLRQVNDRLLDHAGVEFDYLTYNSADLALIRRKLGPRLRVSIRVSDEDLGYIWVEVPDRDIWVKVACVNQEYAAGLTRWQHKKCKALVTLALQDNETLTLAEARLEILNMIKEEQGNVKQGRRKQRARMKEKAPQPVAAEPIPLEAPQDAQEWQDEPDELPDLDVFPLTG